MDAAPLRFIPVHSFPLFWVLILVSARGWAAEQTKPATLFDEALVVSKSFDPDVDLKKCREAWSIRCAIIKSGLEVRAARKKASLDPMEKVAVINRYLLHNREVSYISNKYWRDSLFTAALEKNKGNCLSTSLLYHLLAQEVNLPIRLAFAPGHAFVRWDDGKTKFNIETTNLGETVSDEEMMALFGLSEDDLKPNGFMVTLTDDQIRASLLGIWANVSRTMEHEEEAWGQIRQARKLWPENAAIQMQEASFYLFQGKAELAERLFKKIYDERTSTWARCQAALAYGGWLESQGRAKEAIVRLNPLLKLARGPQLAEVLERLGNLYRHLRDFEQAIAIHRLQVEMDPGADSYNDLGSVLTEAHQDVEAIKAYEKSLSYNPENFFTRVILAGLYERAGDQEKGRAKFSEIQKPREHLLTWFNALVWYYANIKDEPKLLVNMEEALKRDLSGHTYQYFIREPDLDPYRQSPAFIELMKKYAPPAQGGRNPKKSDPVEP